VIYLTRGKKRGMIGGNRPNSSPYDTILPPTGTDPFPAIRRGSWGGLFRGRAQCSATI
jgi:hypothetical protein